MEEFVNCGLSVVDSIKTETEDAPKKDQPKEDSLIITTEEYLECCDSTAPSCSTVDVVPVEKNIKPTSSTSKSTATKIENHQVLWATNLTRHAKAFDLRNFISSYAKVKTVKILTNGKEFFGYIVMRSPEDASKCKEHLNGKLFQQHKINFQYEKPNKKKTKQDKLRESQHTTKEHDWKKEYMYVKDEVTRLRQKIQVMERRIIHLKMKLSTENELIISMKNLNAQREKLREEQKSIERQRRRLNADRDLISKSTAEMRGIREDINKKLNELKISNDNVKIEKPSSDQKRKWPKNHSSSLKKHSSDRYSEDEMKKYRQRTPSPTNVSRCHSENDKFNKFLDSFGPNNNVLSEQQNQWRYDNGYGYHGHYGYKGGSYQNRDTLFQNQSKFNSNKSNNHRDGYFERKKY